MLTLFKINTQKKILMDKAALKLCPEFKNLKQEQLMYIILAYDYRSKYHQFPELERKRKAAYEVYNDPDYDAEGGKLMKNAIQNYIGLQYDPRRETVKNYTTKVSKINQDLLDEENPKVIANQMAAIDRLLSTMKSIQEEIDSDDDKVMMQGDGQLSYIETLHEMENNLNNYLDTRVKVKKENV